MKKYLHFKKVILCIITILCLFICSLESILASENFNLNNNVIPAVYNIMENYIPEDVGHYFNQIYDSAISIGRECGLIDESMNEENLAVGNPFKIFELDDEDKNIWYFPIYNESEMILIITIGLIDNALNFSLTQEFAEQLNKVSYNCDMLFFKENNIIYIIDRENNIYSISYGELKKCEINKNYSELKKYLSLYYTVSTIPDSVEKAVAKNTNKMSAKGGVVSDINGGRECVMTNCFVKQYEYSLCWAASAATILRYLKPEYSALNAFDVAYTLAYYEDISTDNPDDVNRIWRRGATNDEAQFVLAVYGVYYSTLNRKLSYFETKKEIDNGYPVYVYAHAYYDNRWHAHATVLYGYYTKERYQYYKMWNPGNGTSQTVTYNISGDAIYFYNNHYFEWKATVYNGIHNMK